MREREYYLLETEKEEIRRRVEALTAEEAVTMRLLGIRYSRVLPLSLMMIMPENFLLLLSPSCSF